MTPRIASLQALRALAALSVIYLHALDYAGIVDGHYRLAIGVDIFFILSGYIVTHSALQAGSSWEFAAKRLWRILPLYYLASTLELFHQGFVFTRFWHSLCLWPRPDDLYLTVGWTLSYELLFYALLAARRIRLALAALACLAFWNPILLLFALGLGLRLLPAAWRPAAFALLPIALFSPSHPAMAECARIVSGEYSLQRVLAWGPIALACVTTALALNRLRMPDWLITLGNASYCLYLFQIFGLMAGAKFNPGLHGEVYALWLTAISAAGGLLAYRFLEKSAKLKVYGKRQAL